MWLRFMLLEMLNPEFRATDSVLGKPGEFAHVLPIMSITDCHSLHETVVKSSLPQDHRAAFEVLAIRELLTTNHATMDESDPEDTRLKESRLEQRFHWCTSSEQKADILTKMSTGVQRRQWKERWGPCPRRLLPHK